MTYRTHSSQETQDVAKTFAEGLKGGELVALVGDLGAGKTTFVQGIAASLGVGMRVTSPTFAVMHEYPCDHSAIRRLVHIDVYRMHDADELRALALEDERRPDTVVVVEWPNILPDVAWRPDYTVTFAHGKEAGERGLTVVSG